MISFFNWLAERFTDIGYAIEDGFRVLVAACLLALPVLAVVALVKVIVS